MSENYPVMEPAETDRVRRSIRSFLKISPLSHPTEVRFLDRTDEDGFTRERIHYSVPDGEWVEAFLLQPTGAESRGAVLALHQHNSQWAIGKSEVAGLTGDPLQAFGPALARRGVTVLVPDAVGFESRQHAQPEEHLWPPHSIRPTARQRAGCSITTRWLIAWCAESC